MSDRSESKTRASVGPLPSILADIVYVIPVEDGDPRQASLLQGFAPSLSDQYTS